MCKGGTPLPLILQSIWNQELRFPQAVKYSIQRLYGQSIDSFGVEGGFGGSSLKAVVSFASSSIIESGDWKYARFYRFLSVLFSFV
jgi:hypothetical protein